MRETVDSCGPSARCCSVQTESSSASYDSSATDQPRAVPPMPRFAETPRTSVQPPTVRHRKTLLNQKIVVQQVDRRSTQRSSRFAPPKRPPPKGPLSNIRPISPLRPISPISSVPSVPFPILPRTKKTFWRQNARRFLFFVRIKKAATHDCSSCTSICPAKPPPATPHSSADTNQPAETTRSVQP